VIKLSIPSRPVKQMTEKLQLVDAGLGEREVPEEPPRSRAPLEKSQSVCLCHCANLVATGHSSNKMTAILFSLLFNFEALANLIVTTQNQVAGGSY
jgi:hypothetical protein